MKCNKCHKNTAVWNSGINRYDSGKIDYTIDENNKLGEYYDIMSFYCEDCEDVTTFKEVKGEVVGDVYLKCEKCGSSDKIYGLKQDFDVDTLETLEEIDLDRTYNASCTFKCKCGIFPKKNRIDFKVKIKSFRNVAENELSEQYKKDISY